MASPTPPAPAARPAPQPEPEQVRVAAAEPPPETPSTARVALRQPRVAAPLPPSRPFDLGPDQSMFVTVAAVTAQPAHVVTPPRRPDLQASAEKALYYAENGARRVKLTPTKAFDRLKIPQSTRTDD
jgi:hypothetical protein